MRMRAVVAGLATVTGLLGAPAVAAAADGPCVVGAGVPTVVVGVHDVKSQLITASVREDCGVGGVRVTMTRGAKVVTQELAPGGAGSGVQEWTGTHSWDPAILDNVDAGTWTTTITLVGSGTSTDEPGPDFYLQRWSRIESQNASPEPVVKGATVTVTGKLSRANWDDYAYHGYAIQLVDLQYRTTTGSYGTLKTVSTSSTGQLSTTTTATADGCYRWSFDGTTTTMPVTVAGDCVDVQAETLPNVRITLINFDAYGTDTTSNVNDEYVRIVNGNSRTVYLQGATLSDLAGHVYVFPDRRIAAGDYMNIRTGTRVGGDTPHNLYWGQGWHVWNNDGDTATLKNAAGTMLDTCSYSGEGSYASC